MAEHVLEVEIQTKLGSSVSDVNSFKNSLEEALEIVERFQASLGNLSIDSDLKDLLSNLSSFSGGTIKVEYGEGAPVYNSGGSFQSQGTVDVTGQVKELAWASGANHTISEVEALVSKLTPIGDLTIRGINARVSEFGFESTASRTLHNVSARISSAKWEDGASKILHSTEAYVTSIKQGRGAETIRVNAIVNGIVSGEDVIGTVRDSNRKAALGILPASIIPKFASGQVITVGEGAGRDGGWEDEFVIPRSELEKGPKHLDNTVSYLVKGSEGGSNVIVDNLQDTAIIPKSRYQEFKSKIYGFDFADGHLPYGGAFENGNVIYGIESYSDLSDFILSLQNIISQANSISPDSLGFKNQEQEITTSLERRADNIYYSVEKAINLFERVKGDTENLPGVVSSIQGIPDGLKELNSIFTDLSEDLNIKLTSLFGDNKDIDEAIKKLAEAQEKLAGHIKDVDKTTWGPEQTATNTGGGTSEDVSSTVVHYSSADVSYGSLLTRIYDEVTSGKRMMDYLNLKRSEEGTSATREEQAAFSKNFQYGMNLGGGFFSSLFDMGTNVHETILKRTLSTVQDIYDKLKEASPLLQAVETLFNLAMRLFFMPLGNKLAEILIPATVDLVEKITDMWDMFDEGMSLGEMFEVAIDYGVDSFAGYFEEIGEELSAQGGIVGSIGKLLVSISNFLEQNGEKLLTFLMNMMTNVIEHFREIIAAIVAFKIASYANTIMLTYAIYQANTFANQIEGAIPATEVFLAAMKTAATVAGVSALLGLIGGVATEATLDYYIPRNAEGGYVPATPGGRIVRVGEGGEGEYIIPESMLDAVVSGGNAPLKLLTEGATVTDAYSDLSPSASPSPVQRMLLSSPQSETISSSLTPSLSSPVVSSSISSMVSPSYPTSSFSSNSSFASSISASSSISNTSSSQSVVNETLKNMITDNVLREFIEEEKSAESSAPMVVTPALRSLEGMIAMPDEVGANILMSVTEDYRGGDVITNNGRGSDNISFITGNSSSDTYTLNGPSTSSSNVSSTSNMNNGDTIINYYINGYTDSELKHIIINTVNEIVIDSRVKGRYW